MLTQFANCILKTTPYRITIAFMLAGRSKSIKPQDILLLLKVFLHVGKEWRIIDLARDLDLSPSEVTHGLERLRHCGLLDSSKRKLHRAAVLEFLVHGLKYVFPADRGTIVRGLPTAHSYNSTVVHDMAYVWPCEDGPSKGIAISPLYDSVPYAAQRDEELHRLLALIDSLRVGRVREQNDATEELARVFA